MTTDFEQAKKEFEDFWSENQILHNEAKDVFIGMIKTFLAEKVVLSSISGRVKDRDECIGKFSRKYRTELEGNDEGYQIKDHITDLIGLRIVCLHEKDIDIIGEILKEEFKVIDITDKTQIMNEKENSFGYKGLHLDLKLNEKRQEMSEYKRFSNLRFEIQIRTIIQDAWSVLDHKIQYKKTPPTHIKRRINALAALFEIADKEFFSLSEEIKQAFESAKLNSSSKNVPNDAKLDVFSFIAITSHHFKNYEFEDYKVDSFVEEILSFDSTLTVEKLNSTLIANIGCVKKYDEFLSEYNDDLFRKHSLNPYTQIRHILYMSNQSAYNNILYSRQRARFDEWLQENHKNGA